ncbi:MAG: hypothetical protein HKN36_01835 [Hellea sp.]|nr:hypothetical protein [Hellea sp.]
MATGNNHSYAQYDSPEAIAGDPTLSQPDKMALLGDWAVKLLDDMFASNDNGREAGTHSRRVEQFIEDIKLVAS